MTGIPAVLAISVCAVVLFIVKKFSIDALALMGGFTRSGCRINDRPGARPGDKSID